MKHITFASKSLLVGDDAADTLLEYAALLAQSGQADTVELNAINADGNAVVATFLLDAGASLMAESTTSEIEAPDNAEAIEYMRSEIGSTFSALLPDDMRRRELDDRSPDGE
ncbi:hypothetical protein [Frigoribacterium faeni]|uniref:Uncharacterized protein n=1 Tax=Frigoribacterium faeni TaxID=145483 RepID=A0A7W3PK82_9MICO|nr:hypothetical protein [Frigoribacterium faeni]MBA8814691.1 hypothetical protein [Frigoribacterium faeni]BFF15616.1 hypothetical protein GCM10025699_69190 [Microbacterium flavescens]GEK82959.1 hypothetical protein FFA01_12680 [Frigoribacterium faeni]